jgi:hypothetical protein
MACHTVNMPFRSLQLGYPDVIESESSGMNGETYPLASKIRFEFPARGGSASSDAAKGAQQLLVASENAKAIAMPPLKLWWYDGGKPDLSGARGGHDGSNKPAKEITADIEAFQGEVPGSGCVIIGDNGTIFSPDDYGAQFFIKLKGESKFSFYKKHPVAEAVAQTLPRNNFKGDADARHHLEWIEAIKQGKPELCYSRFDITAYLTEIMLLGCVALRVGKKLEWDGPAMRAKNVPEAARFVQRENRPGWVV